jgi:hypothetical protein
MKHLLFLLMSLMLVTVAAANPASDKASALVDTPKVYDISRADPTDWPLPIVWACRFQPLPGITLSR